MGTSTVMVGHCQKCHAPIGELTREELDYVVFDSRNQLLCFHCDDLGLDQFPAIFSPCLDGDRFVIDDLVFVVDKTEKNVFAPPLARAHESARARGLSSSTYLNRNNEKLGVLDELIEFRMCEYCLWAGKTWEEENGGVCRNCGGTGKVAVAIFLPLWLVNGVRENA